MKNKKWFRTYLFIWTGQFISTLTSYAVQFAVIIWLSLEYDSAEVLAFAGIAGLLPQAIIGPFVGVFVDRWDRKMVMISSDIFIAVCTFAMTFILRENVNLIGFTCCWDSGQWEMHFTLRQCKPLRHSLYLKINCYAFPA